MKASIVAAAAMLGAASAQKAIVHNGCKSPIYVQSFPDNNDKPGELKTLHTGEEYSEALLSSGSTIKIGTTKTLTDPLPLFFGYSEKGDTIFYEFSTEWGNPFNGSHNTLIADEGCKKFDCQANDADCYSTKTNKQVYPCPKPVDVVAQICA
ncbi:hypothetical protein E4U53_005357 [Claviceps sorghi]|nr:hypothetical protein E4U53_005357 [Claviceps sorghi]